MPIWYNGNVDKFYVTGDTNDPGPWDIDTGISLDPYDGECHHVYKKYQDNISYIMTNMGPTIVTNTSDLVTNNNTVKIFSHYSDSTQVQPIIKPPLYIMNSTND